MAIGDDPGCLMLGGSNCSPSVHAGLSEQGVTDHVRVARENRWHLQLEMRRRIFCVALSAAAAKASREVF